MTILMEKKEMENKIQEATMKFILSKLWWPNFVEVATQEDCDMLIALFVWAKKVIQEENN